MKTFLLRPFVLRWETRVHNGSLGTLSLGLHINLLGIIPDICSVLITRACNSLNGLFIFYHYFTSFLSFARRVPTAAWLRQVDVLSVAGFPAL